MQLSLGDIAQPHHSFCAVLCFLSKKNDNTANCIVIFHYLYRRLSLLLSLGVEEASNLLRWGLLELLLLLDNLGDA